MSQLWLVLHYGVSTHFFGHIESNLEHGSPREQNDLVLLHLDI